MFNLQFEVYGVGREGDGFQRLATLQCPGAATRPSVGFRWFLVGKEVGLPVPQTGPVAQSCAFRPTEDAILRFAIPNSRAHLPRETPLPGITVPFSTIILAAQSASKPEVTVPVEVWAGAQLQLSDHRPTTLWLIRKNRETPSTSGTFHDLLDFHPDRTYAAEKKALSGRSVANSCSEIPIPCSPLTSKDNGHAYDQYNSYTLQRDGYVDEDNHFCCSAVSSTTSAPLTERAWLQTPRQPWRSHPPTWIDTTTDCLPDEDLFVGSQATRCIDTIVRYTVRLHSQFTLALKPHHRQQSYVWREDIVGRGLYVHCESLDFSPLTACTPHPDTDTP